MSSDFAAARLNMVESQIRTADVTDLPLQDALRVVPRENLVPAGKGYLDNVAIADVKQWEIDFHAFMADKHSNVLHAIAESGKLEDDTVENLTHAIEEFIAGRAK